MKRHQMIKLLLSVLAITSFASWMSATLAWDTMLSYPQNMLITTLATTSVVFIVIVLLSADTTRRRRR